MKPSEFPYGKAHFYIVAMAVISGGILFATGHWGKEEAPDLTFTIFAINHFEAYESIVAEFEEEYDVKVSMQLVDARALENRLQAALLSGSPVPDIVELRNGAMGFFTRGPLEDVGLLDLTDRVQSEGLDQSMVNSRFSLWSSRGRIFALPHDVHPIVLAYRRDLVEELGIDVDELDTWEKFVQVGREVTKDLDGNGTIDRYMIDMNRGTADYVNMLMLQRGGGLSDKDGNVTLYTQDNVELIVWLIHQFEGPDRIAFNAGWGQSLAKAMMEGFVLFYFAPDWRTKMFETDVPSLSGKMEIMPVPAWEPGGRRTTTWGGTGLCITRECKNPDLAWTFAKYLYLNTDILNANFTNLNIISAYKPAWNLPAIDEPNTYYSGQKIGRILADLAPSTPPDYSSPYVAEALIKAGEAFVNGIQYYKSHGDDGLEEYVDKELKRCHDQVQRVQDQNLFLAEQDGEVSEQ
jgi:arabinosaccharide transport system substrate-binding protein